MFSEYRFVEVSNSMTFRPPQIHSLFFPASDFEKISKFSKPNHFYVVSNRVEVKRIFRFYRNMDEEIVNVNAGLSGAVSNVDYNPNTKSISVQKGAGEAVVTALSGLFDSVSYNGATGVLSFTTNGGTAQTVNLPVEQFLAAASYDEVFHTLTLTMTDNSKFEVDLADLIDTYTGGESATAEVEIANGAVTANVKLSAEASNLVEAKADGIFVAPLAWQTLA